MTSRQITLADNVSHVTAANQHCCVNAIDLKALMEALVTNQGMEINVQSCEIESFIFSLGTLPVTLAGAYYFVVSDSAAITSGNTAADRQIDYIIDQHCTGDFEFSQITPTKLLRVIAGVSTSPVNHMQFKVNITKQLNKAIRKLMYSALLSTNPQFAIVFIGHNVTGTPSLNVQTKIDLKYTVRAKASRII